MHFKVQVLYWMFIRRIAQWKEFWFTFYSLKKYLYSLFLISLEYIWEIFNYEFCWLGWSFPKKLFWPLTNVLWESASCSHHRLCLLAVLSGGRRCQWLFIVVLHSIFGYNEEFSVVLRPIVMMYFQPYLWCHAFQKQKRFVFLTYLHKHFASYFLFSVLILTCLHCVYGGSGGVLANVHEWIWAVAA